MALTSLAEHPEKGTTVPDFPLRPMNLANAFNVEVPNISSGPAPIDHNDGGDEDGEVDGEDLTPGIGGEVIGLGTGVTEGLGRCQMEPRIQLQRETNRVEQSPRCSARWRGDTSYGTSTCPCSSSKWAITGKKEIPEICSPAHSWPKVCCSGGQREPMEERN